MYTGHLLFWSWSILVTSVPNQAVINTLFETDITW